jgi:LuxR family maltose regulon positive regulatory protein
VNYPTAGEETTPKLLPHAFIWSHERQHYQLFSHNQPGQIFLPADQSAFSGWLDEHTAFAFLGQAGKLSVLKEVRPRGSGYWYAYRTHNRHTRKRYLGRSSQVTFARLEQVAQQLLSSSSSPTPAALSQPFLLSNKLAPPRLPISLVQRPGLLDELDAIHSHSLTLVSASAGSGKTTLLSAWVAASVRQQAQRSRAAGEETAFAWLSLEELDNDPIRFWASCILALRTCLPTLGEMALAMLYAQEALPLTTCLTTLLHEIEQVANEIILFLDDYHVIAEQTITESMAFLLDHLPANMHLVLISRTDPEFPLSVLRMRRQLFEIRDQDLCFTRAETSRFLVEGMGLPLTEDEVTALHTRTEGWVAGLQLAALSLSRREDLSVYLANFAGSHRFVLDYVQQDILARLPERLQDFVLQTSVLTRMNAALCQAVTGLPSASACQELLETLERRNLFVVPLDAQRHWYRYHDLFREALLARLHLAHPDLVPLLHIRAARWYETADQMREAVAHALSAADYPYAVSLMERAAPDFWRSGEVKTVYNWVMALPDTVLHTSARFALSVAYRLQEGMHMSKEMLQGTTRTQVEQILVRIEQVLLNQPSPVLPQSEVGVLLRRLCLLRGRRAGLEALMVDDAETLSRLAQEMQEAAEEEQVTWKVIPVSLTFWLRGSLLREGGLLVPMLEQFKQETKLSGDHLMTLRVMSMLTCVYSKAGRLRKAEQEGLAGLELAKHLGMQTPIIGYLHYWLSLIYYERNQIEVAFQSIQRVRYIAQIWQHAELLGVGAVFLSYIALARGDFAMAEQALQEAEQNQQRHPIVWMPSSMDPARVWYWLKIGYLAAAKEWAEQTSFDLQGWKPKQKSALLMLVRVYLAQHQSALALQTLERFREHLDQPGDIPVALQWMTLYAVALQKTGQSEQAVCVAARLVQMTEPEGFIRVYLDAGSTMKQVLTMLLEAPSSADQEASMPVIKRLFVSRLLALFEQEEQKRVSRRDEQPDTPQEALSSNGSPLSFVLPEPLTTAELRVLRELSAGRSNREIADLLVVSLNTVKTHVKHLYSKLAVKSRMQASQRARDLHLL